MKYIDHSVCHGCGAHYPNAWHFEGKAVHGRSSNRTFCSRRCESQAEGHMNYMNGEPENLCDNCGVPCRGVYCSNDCMEADNRLVNLPREDWDGRG